MAIDTSIYGNIQPVQAPDMMDSAKNAMNLSQMAIQNQQMKRQVAIQQAARQAYTDNLDANGNLNEGAYLSTLGRIDPNMRYAAQEQIGKANKSTAEAGSAQNDAYQKKASIFAGTMHTLDSIQDEDQRAKVYPAVMASLQQQGVIDPDKQGIPMQYNSDWFNSTLRKAQTHMGDVSTPALANQKTQAEIQNLLAQQGIEGKKTGASELAAYKDDVLNASSRKTTGSLIEGRDRADRILSLLNSDAPPNETQQEKVARLNKLMPQIGTEVSTSLAAIMQGGVPNESLQKEVGIDTWNSKLAKLKQQASANPTAANQGAILDAYAEMAKKLRDFTAGRLAQNSKQIRAAYPYANKYFANEMDQIAKPLEAPVAGGAPIQRDGNMLARDMTLEPNANAAPPKLPPLPAGMIRVQFKDGTIRKIPENLMGAAQRDGGKVVN